MSDDQTPPDGWTVATLDESGTWRGGGTPSKSISRYWNNGSIHWVSPKDMKRLLIDSAQDQITHEALENSATNLIPKRSVLMVTRSGILEHSFPVAINTIPVAINQDLKAWTPNKGIDPLYAAYFLKARAQHLLNSCSKDGTTVSSIDFDRLGAYKLLLAPQGEQKRIISKIDALFSRIEEGERALERVQKLVERYRQSVLKAAVTGELTREWREKHKGKLESGETLLARILKVRREAWEKSELDKMKAKGQKPENDNWKRKYKEPVPPDTSELPDLPDGWVWASLGALIFNGPQNGLYLHKDKYGKGTPIIRIDDFQSGWVRPIAELQRVTANDSDREKYAIAAGEFVLNRVNSISHLGKCILLPSEYAGCLFESNMMRFIITDQVSRAFVENYLSSDLGRKILIKNCKHAVNQASINQDDVARTALPLPPLPEQIEIADAIVRESSRGGENTLNLPHVELLSISLRQTILRAAFQGNLLGQDSTDEPASILLERIAAERNRASKNNAPKRCKREMVTA